ncbi:hypothetical protein LguiA_026102 [Lonicera macranthoides]
MCVYIYQRCPPPNHNPQTQSTAPLPTQPKQSDRLLPATTSAAPVCCDPSPPPPASTPLSLSLSLSLSQSTIDHQNLGLEVVEF